MIEKIWMNVNKSYWLAMEKVEKATSIPVFSKFVTPLEVKGVPSLLVLTALFLAIAGGFFLAFQPIASTSTFTIRVLSTEGTPLNGIEVTLTAQDNGVSQTVTAVNGIAEFNLPPGKKYNLAVSGGLQPSTDVVVVRQGATQLIRLTAQSDSNFVYVHVVNQIELPVPNAVVEYTIGENVKRSKTNVDGLAPLQAEEGTSVTVEVTAVGYENAKVSYIVSKQVKKITVLEEFTGASANLNLLAIKRSIVNSPNGEVKKTGSLTVNVDYLSETGFKPVSKAYVVIYNAFSKTVIAEGETNLQGVAQFKKINAGNEFNLYAVIEKDGFVTKVSEEKLFQNSLEMKVTLSQSTAENSVDFLVKLKGASTSGDVFVISTQGVILSTKRNVNSQVVARGLPREKFYVAVTSRNAARFVSSLIDPSALQEFTVELKGVEKTAAINVKVVDFQQKPVAAANVNLLISNTLSPPTTRSNSLGETEFENVPLGTAVAIKGEKNSFVGQETFIIQGEANKTLVLKPPTGTVALSVVDYTSNEPIYEPEVKIYYAPAPGELIEIPAECVITREIPACTLSLLSGVRYVAVASKNGFQSTSIEFEATPMQHTATRIRLFPSTFNRQVEFLGIYDAETGVKVEQNLLLVGKIYSAKFAVKTNKELSQAGTYGFYSRIGGEEEQFASSNLPIGIAFISPEFSPTSSLFYSQFINGSDGSSGDCASRIEQSGLGLYKWVFAQSESFLAPASYAELIVPLAPIVEGEVKLEYFALTTFKQGEEIERVIRYPEDAVLANSFSTREKKWCAADTESIDLKIEKRDVVKCNKNACMKLWLSQGESISFTNFQAQASGVVNKNLDLHFEITDFEQSPSIVSFSPPREILRIDAATTRPSTAVNSAENKYENSFESFKVNGVISSIVEPQRATQDLNLRFGNKIASEISLEVLAPPAPPIELPELGTLYEIFYDKTKGEIKILNEEREPGEVIEMYTDPIMPADAVFVLFNYSSSTCENGQGNFLTALNEESNCFELIDAPSSLADSTPGLKLLKYDATKYTCSAHSIDLNKVNEIEANLTVQHTCTPARKDFAISVKIQRDVAREFTTYNSLFSHVIFTEPADDLENLNPFEEVPRSLWALLINRQYSKEEKVKIGGVNSYLSDQFEDAIISHDVGSTAVKSALASGMNFRDELGASTPLYLSELFTVGVKDKQLASQDFEDVKNQVKIIAENTVYRRKPATCNANPECKLKTFPLSAFKPSGEFSYQLGAGYLGTNREHKVNFAAVESPGKGEDGKAMQGVYALSIDYKKIGETYRWVTTAQPLTITQSDYYDGDCSSETQLVVPGAMSWRRTTCLQTCGDGTYFDLEQGDSASLCSGNSFSVSRFWTQTHFLKTIELATELSACLAAGCGTVYTCAAGWSASCQTATAAIPYSAPAVAAACSPKGTICGTSLGVAAGLGAAEGVEHLLSEPSGCDVVGDLASAGIGGLATYGILYNYPPNQAANSVCRSILNFGPVGSDAEAASQIVTSACVGMIGTRFISLIASWINHGFIDKDALSDRAYIDITGSGGGYESCTNWAADVGRYFVYQDCEFYSLWARNNEIESCNSAQNVKLFTKDLAISPESGLSNFNGKITFKIKS